MVGRQAREPYDTIPGGVKRAPDACRAHDLSSHLLGSHFAGAFGFESFRTERARGSRVSCHEAVARAQQFRQLGEPMVGQAPGETLDRRAPAPVTARWPIGGRS
jgi:hypothetical protein